MYNIITSSDIISHSLSIIQQKRDTLRLLLFLENETDAYNPNKCCVQNTHSFTIPYLLYREQGWVDDTLLDQWEIINVTNLSLSFYRFTTNDAIWHTMQTFKATNSNSAARSILSHDKPNQSRDSHDGEGAQQLRASLVTWPKRATMQQFNTIWWATVSDPRILENHCFPHHRIFLTGTNTRLRREITMWCVFL